MHSPISRALFCSIIVLTSFASTSTQAAEKIPKKVIKSVESGNASHIQKTQYITGTMMDQAKHYAMIQAWSVNPGEFPIQTYAEKTDQNKIPVFIRNTDAGRLMLEQQTFYACYKEEACANHLVAIAQEVNKIPDDILQTAYSEKSKLDAEKLQTQIGININKMRTDAENASTQQASTPSETPIQQPGKILDFIVDPISGSMVSQKVSDSGNQVVTKEIDGEEITLAEIADTGSKLLITLDASERYQAKDIKLTYFGFIMTNDDGVFRVTEDNVYRLTIPEGYWPAKMQRRNIYETGHMILEKTGSDKGAANAVKSLGSMFGVGKKQDYILFNLLTGASHLLPVDSSNKTVAHLSNCTKSKNGLFNECSNSNLVESTRRQDGSENSSHYFNAVDWTRTRYGEFAVYRDGMSKLMVINLQTGERRLAFKRGLGINWFELEGSETGNISLIARLGFKSQTIENLAESFPTLAKLESREIQ